VKKTDKNQGASANAGANALSKIDEALIRKEEIADRIEEINSEKGMLFKKQSGLRTAISDLQNRLDRIPSDDQLNSKLRQSLNDELQQARHDFSQASANEKALDDEFTHLKKIELPSLTVALYAEGLLEHRRRIEQATMELKNVQAVIEAQHQAISAADATIISPIDRQNSRQDIMADIALGNATASDLRALDDEIADERKAIQEAQKKAAPLLEKAQLARSVLPGLERKLSAAQAQLHAIESKSSEVEHRFFLGEAENVAVQFVNHALRLKELYIRLAGLDSIITSLGGDGIMHGHKKLHIPVFQLPQFEGLENPDIGQGTFFSADHEIYSEQVAEAAEAEKSRIDVLSGV
jgi:chromosome segregation ATPase